MELMSSIRVEPEWVHSLAIRFGGLASDLETLSTGGIAVGDTGDDSLTIAIERFLEQSGNQTIELTRQFGEIQTVLDATVLGYDDVESHVATEAAEDLGTTVGPEG